VTLAPNGAAAKAGSVSHLEISVSTELATLMSTPWEHRSLGWLQRMLQIAIKLELATIPPYLCAYWSIDEDKPGYIKRRLQRIVNEEMRHLGLACNLLGAFHHSPDGISADVLPILNEPGFVPTYPGPLPGGVHPGLIVSLSQLTKDQIGTQFMQIEFPHPEAVMYGLPQKFCNTTPEV
jgi:hypothetical protein